MQKKPRRNISFLSYVLNLSCVKRSFHNIDDLETIDRKDDFVLFAKMLRECMEELIDSLQNTLFVL